MEGLKRNNYNVGQNCFHLVWKVKYAYSFLNRHSLKACVEGMIKLIAAQYGWQVHELQVMPDHVHLVVKTSVSINPSKVVQLIKGASSYLFFRFHPKARLRYPRGHLWSKGKFIASIGFTDLDFTIAYVLHQEEHHDSPLINTSGNHTL